jgi:hypothetical protein
MRYSTLYGYTDDNFNYLIYILVSIFFGGSTWGDHVQPVMGFFFFLKVSQHHMLREVLDVLLVFF